MADRSTLHHSDLPDLTIWLKENGWEIEGTGADGFKVLQARLPIRKHPLMIYYRINATEHLTILDRDMGIIRQYLKYKKGQRNAASNH